MTDLKARIEDLNKQERDAFLEGYLECALWVGTEGDDVGTPLDERFDLSAIAPEAVRAAQSDCEAFQRANETDLALYYEGLSYEPGQGGHDFCLTRNGHGTGFWDRCYGKDAALVAVCERLSDAARACGETDLYAGDDDKLYFSS